MYRLVVHYPEPKDTNHFRDYYESTHLPLAQKLPRLVSARYSLDVAGLEGAAPYFAAFEADFASAEDLTVALSSPEGAAVAADVPNYATGGAQMAHYPLRSIGPDGRDLVTRYLDRWNAHDVNGILKMFAPKGVYTDPSLDGREVRGDLLAEHLEQLFTIVPDLQLSVMAASQDGPHKALAFWRMAGTATGPHPSSNEGQYDLFGADFLNFDDSGEITWTAALYDQKCFAEQGGFVPAASE